MFSCGWLPPVAAMHVGLIVESEVELNSLIARVDHSAAEALAWLGAFLGPTGTWLCAGRSEMFRVCAVSPPSSPREMPLPTWIGLRPWRLGRAKFTRPSPP